MYEFSVPMPFEIDGIDKLVEINHKIKKSKITSLYFAMPGNCTDVTGFELLRTSYKINTNFDYWAEINSVCNCKFI